MKIFINNEPAYVFFLSDVRAETLIHVYIPNQLTESEQ